MPGLRNVIHTDDLLIIGSKYLRYHVRMYVETLLWLQDHNTSPEDWSTVRNAILEDHLVHARILINFICDSAARDTDVLAADYFHDRPNFFYPAQDDFLKNQANNIGGQLVHLTTKPMPKLKSEQEWLIRKTASALVPAISVFLKEVPEKRLAEGVKTECLDHLAKLFPPRMPVSLNAST